MLRNRNHPLNTEYSAGRQKSPRNRYFLPAVILLVGFILAVAVPALAQTPIDAEVDFFLDPADAARALTVGDLITLHLEVRHPARSQVILPQVPEQWDSLEVVSQTPPETITNIDGTAVTRKQIVVRAFEPGPHQTPRLVVTHRMMDETIEELAAPVVVINITSVLTDDLELRDLKPQIDMPVPPIWPYVVGGILLTMLTGGLLAGAGLWLYHRLRPRPALVDAPVPVVADPRPPEEIALAELARIEALNLPDQGLVKQHYSLVTDCLRQYIENRYRLPALEQTTAEIRASLRQTGITMRSYQEFMNLFSEGDLVKFARYRPSPAEVSSLVGRARALVLATTPAPAPAQADKEAE
ncbi:MAG: hypothetical protein D6784_01600 [Chloroflexi bacterium]|nr:MAG: hypothetical protein D6784_01600 [Chloroflexota bacterium]